jgi:hypothetical protein
MSYAAPPLTRWNCHFGSSLSLHDSHNFIEWGFLHNRFGIGCHDISDLASCVRTYSFAKRPWPRKTSSQLGLRLSVPVSARRKRSPPVTTPTSSPEASSTGRPLNVQDHALRRLKYRGSPKLHFGSSHQSLSLLISGCPGTSGRSSECNPQLLCVVRRCVAEDRPAA